MLYATTRSKIQIDTPNNALCRDFAPDKGLYVPYQLPKVSDNVFDSLKKLDFGECMAQVINQFFGTKLTGWDLDFSIGRNPVRLNTLNSRVVIMETWHNLSGEFSGMAKRVAAILQKCDAGEAYITNWLEIAIRIAVIFSAFGELKRKKLIGKNQFIDVSVATEDLSSVVAAWYCKAMGLPIGNIICGCNDNSGIWDLMRQGELNTGASVIRTDTPKCDFAVPLNLERLIYETLGREEALRFAQTRESGGIYHLSDNSLIRLRSGIYPAVVGKKRMLNVMRSTFATHNYAIDPYTALAYGALQDYWTSTGELGTALILSDRNPEHLKTEQ